MRSGIAIRFTISLVLMFVAVASQTLVADDQQPPAIAKPPRIALCYPLGVSQAGTTKLTLRGWSLKDASQVTTDCNGMSIKILNHASAPVPGRQKAEEIGDEQLDVEVTLPENMNTGEAKLIVITPAGSSAPHTLLVGSDSPVVDEQEPNDGFKQAQQLSLPQTVSGSIHADGNVDVFAVDLNEETPLSVKVIAATLGSNCDALLTIYSASGSIIANSDDDGSSRDATIDQTLPSGRYFITLQDAHDRSGPAHPYRLTVNLRKK